MHASLRKHPRALLGRPVMVDAPHQLNVAGDLIDLSISGAQLSLNNSALAKSLKKKKTIRVRWSVVPGTKSLELKAVIEWIHLDDLRVGVSWLHLPLLARKVIQSVVYFHRC